MNDVEEMTVTADELRAELSERGALEFEIASLRATNRKLVAIITGLRNTMADMNGE